MKKGIKKSTPEQIEKMRNLYRAGLSLTEIGKRVGRDHTTPLYWVKKKGDYDPNRKIIDASSLIEINEPKIEKSKSEKPEVIAEPKIKESPSCMKCGRGKIDPKWRMTGYCSLKCWHEYHYPLKNYW